MIDPIECIGILHKLLWQTDSVDDELLALQCIFKCILIELLCSDDTHIALETKGRRTPYQHRELMLRVCLALSQRKSDLACGANEKYVQEPILLKMVISKSDQPSQ